MTRDDKANAIGFAIILLVGVCVWAVFAASWLADPGQPQNARQADAALPLPPQSPDRSEIAERMIASLSERDIFRAAGEASEEQLLARAQVAPPVRLEPVSAPSRTTRQSITRTTPTPAPAQNAPARVQREPTQRPAPQYITRAPAASLPTFRQQQIGEPPLPKLRGIVPHPVDGIRALLGVSTGQVVSAALGNRVGGWQVVRLGSSSVTLVSPNGRVQELRLFRN